MSSEYAEIFISRKIFSELTIVVNFYPFNGRVKGGAHMGETEKVSWTGGRATSACTVTEAESRTAKFGVLGSMCYYRTCLSLPTEQGLLHRLQLARVPDTL